MGENIGQNLFFTGEIAFLFKKICVSNNILVVTEKILQFPKVSEHLVDPYKLSLQIFHTRFCQKKQAKIFSSQEMLPFFSKICVYIKLLGPKEMILKLPQ